MDRDATKLNKMTKKQGKSHFHEERGNKGEFEIFPTHSAGSRAPLYSLYELKLSPWQKQR